MQDYVLKEKKEQLQQDSTFVVKWGCDGSSGYSNYHQRFGKKTEKINVQLLGTNDSKLIPWNKIRNNEKRRRNDPKTNGISAAVNNKNWELFS